MHKMVGSDCFELPLQCVKDKLFGLFEVVHWVSSLTELEDLFIGRYLLVFFGKFAYKPVRRLVICIIIPAAMRQHKLISCSLLLGTWSFERTVSIYDIAIEIVSEQNS